MRDYEMPEIQIICAWNMIKQASIDYSPSINYSPDWIKYFYFHAPGKIYLLLLLLVQFFFGLAHAVHKVCFSPLCVFKCVFKLFAPMDVYWHWLHCFAFSQRCIFKCSHKLPAWEYWYPHIHIKCLLKLLALEDTK